MQPIPDSKDNLASDALPYSDSVWKARLVLATRSFRQNWSMFMGTRVGLIGLIIICFYALLAAAHPLLMNTVWEESMYDPGCGLLLRRSPPACRRRAETIC